LAIDQLREGRVKIGLLLLQGLAEMTDVRHIYA